MADPSAAEIVVEVAYAEPARQFLQRVRLPASSTVGDALDACTLSRDFELDIATLDTGILSTSMPRSAMLNDGDRVEVYRSLRADPMDARRRRARQKTAKDRGRDQP